MKSRDGFTVLEVLMAVIVLTVALLGLAQMILISVEKYGFARWETKATQVAQAKIENLKSVFGKEVASGVDDPELINGQHGPEMVVAGTENSYGEPTQFWVSWQVSDLSGGQKLVAVTVSPPVPDANRNETITFMSQFAP